MNIELFCITVAAIIVVTNSILGFLEERDRRKGIPINYKEYKMGGLIWIMIKEGVAKVTTPIKKGFRAVIGKIKKSKK